MIYEDVVKAQAGCKESINKIFGYIRKECYAMCRHITKNDDDAEEVLQECMMVLFQNLGNLKDPDAFGGWAKRTCWRRSINLIRRKKYPVANAISYSTKEGVYYDIVSSYSDPDHEDSEIVHKCILRLKEMDSDVLRLFYFRGMEVKEIARHYGVPVGTVKRRLTVARRRLEYFLTENGCG